jgi:hypothetical protein
VILKFGEFFQKFSKIIEFVVEEKIYQKLQIILLKKIIALDEY